MIELTNEGRPIAVDLARVEAIEDLNVDGTAKQGVRLHMHSGCLVHADGTAADVHRLILRAVTYDHERAVFDASASAVAIGDTVLKDDGIELCVADIARSDDDEAGTPVIRFADAAGRTYTVWRDELVTLVDR